MTEQQEPLASDTVNDDKQERKRQFKVALITAGFLATLLFGYVVGKTSTNATSETTTVTTESPPSLDAYSEEVPTNNDDPYDAYFHIPHCRTSSPYSHSNIDIKYNQSSEDIAELRRRAGEIAGNDYYRQNQLFEKAFAQYAAQKSIEAMSEQEGKIDTLLNLYSIDHETLNGIIAASQQKCPNDFVGQLDEIQIQMEAYSGTGH